MKISIDQVISFTECPKSVRFSRPFPPLYSIAIDVMREVTSGYTKTRESTPWKEVIRLVNEQYLTTFPKTKEIQARKEIERILLFISKWWHGILKISPFSSYYDITLEWILGQHTLSQTVPVITLGKDEVRIGISTHRNGCNIAGSSSYFVVSHALLVSKSLGIDDVVVDWICWQNDKGYSVRNLRFNKFTLKKAEESVSDIIYSIGAKLHYPTTCDYCLKCPTQKTCKL